MRGIALALLWTNLYGYAWCADYYLSAKGMTRTGVRSNGRGRLCNGSIGRTFDPAIACCLKAEVPSRHARTERARQRSSRTVVIVTSYGQGRALLNGGTSRAISSLGCRYVTFRNLALRGAGRKGGNTDSGLYLAAGATSRWTAWMFRGSGNPVWRSMASIAPGYFGSMPRERVCGNQFRRPSLERLYIGYSLAENNPGDPTIHDNHSGTGSSSGRCAAL